MEFVTLGKTKLLVSRSGLSTKLLELVSEQGILGILELAYQAGINFYDVSCQYLECSSGIAKAFYDKRQNVVISVTSTLSANNNITNEIEAALDGLVMDYLDIFSIRSEEKIFEPKDEDGIYAALMTAKSQGKIHHIGFYSHNLELAKKAVLSGLYEVIQYPFNVLSSEEEQSLAKLCEENDVGFIARMPFDGGKIDNIPVAFGYLKQFENVVPVYNAKNYEEIQKLIYFESNPPVNDEKFAEDVAQIRSEL